VLVEGDSDELVFQRAYMERNEGRLPINDGIDVISVGLTFKRFLDIAIQVNQAVAVVTDNDGDYMEKITKKYEDYACFEGISIFADDRESLKTLEPQFVDANKANLKTLCDVIGLKHKDCDSPQRVVDYMLNNKTTWALRVFEAKKSVQYPRYITDAVTWCKAE